MIAIELAARYPSLPAAIVASDSGPIDPFPRTRSLFEGLAAQLEGPDGEAVRRAYVELLFAAADDADRKRRITETMCSLFMALNLIIGLACAFPAYLHAKEGLRVD